MNGILTKVSENITIFGFFGFLKWSINYIRWFIFHRFTKIRFHEKNVNDFRLLLDLKDIGISKELMINRTREEDHLYILEHFLKPGMIVLDCGANIGYYSVLMGKLVGPHGIIYAVEPDYLNYSLLNVNIILNELKERVKTFNFGLSDKTGTEKFYISVMSNRHSFHPNEYSQTSLNILKSQAPIDIPVMTIADFSEGKRNIDLIRMDIEGFEVEVFKGIIPKLEDGEFRPSILFETHPPRYDFEKHDMKQPLFGLFNKGYHVYWLVSDGHIRRGGRNVYKEMGYGDSHVIAEFPRSDRAIYQNIAHDDAAHLICSTDYVRAAFLKRLS